MLAELKSKKIAAATIVETVIALLILMISFASGMVIYGQIVASGVKQQHLQASMETELVLDSLLAAGQREGEVLRFSGRRIKLELRADERFTGAQVVQATCRDSEGNVLAAITKLVADED